MTARTILDLDLAAIDATGRLRKALPLRVEALAEDLDQRGLITPIEVVGPLDDESYRLIYGAHRLAAAKLLGWAEIPAVVHAPDAFADEAEARLREIRENLMRFELNALERAVSVAAWRDIYEAANGKVKRGGDRRKKSQVAINAGEAGNSANIALNGARGISDKLAQIQPGGDLEEQSDKLSLCFSEAAQAEFSLNARAIFRALKIATIPAEIRDRIADSALAANQSELLQLAAQSPERQAQIVGLLLAEPPAAASVADAIAVLDKVPATRKPKPWEKLSDSFSRLKQAEQHRFFEAHREAVELWLAERS
jgi:ParB family chromosome partitioning protein